MQTFTEFAALPGTDLEKMALMMRETGISLEDVMIYRDAKRAEDGSRWSCLYRLAFTWSIISGISQSGYEDRWCFTTYEGAKKAIEEWSGNKNDGSEPDGWIRHPYTGRRRKDGTKATEYIDP